MGILKKSHIYRYKGGSFVIPTNDIEIKNDMKFKEYKEITPEGHREIIRKKKK